MFSFWGTKVSKKILSTKKLSSFKPSTNKKAIAFTATAASFFYASSLKLFFVVSL
jgi:hypothetical protein